MKARRLKIEASGDRWRGGIKPLIRLGGHWLQRAGFAPESRVEVRFVRPGELGLGGGDGCARRRGGGGWVTRLPARIQDSPRSRCFGGSSLVGFGARCFLLC